PRARPWARGRSRARRTAAWRSRLPLQRLVADLDLVALAHARGPQDALELVAGRRRPGDTEAALGAKAPEGAPRRLRPVDEVVDELLLVLRRDRDDDVLRDQLEERALQVCDPRTGRRGHRHDPQDALGLDPERGRLREQVDLVQHDDLRTLVEPRSVRLELRVDRAPELLHVVERRVDDVQQQPCALEMRQELVTEAHTLARALDQPRDVRHDEL